MGRVRELSSEVRRLRALLAQRDREVAELARDLAAARERADRELLTAQRIQVSLMPRTFPDLGPEWQVAARYRAARSIGGDAYDVYPAHPGRAGQLGVGIADVTGKGITAALLMAFCRAVMRTAAWNGTGPADTLQRVNRVLARDVRSGLFVTALVAELTMDRAEVRWASAGHEPPLLLRPSGRVVTLPAGGTMLGLFDPLDTLEHRRRLRRGETFVLLTDGITDAADRRGRRFGDVRLRRALRATAGQGAEATLACILDAVDAFAGDTAQADDLTLLAIHRAG
jgi:sigma-B regulation protein RsbU (phosphoserine phosphatase)